VAIDNLYSRAEQHLRFEPYGPVFAVLMDGNFEASVMLLDSVWDISFADKVRGGLVAAAPASDVLAFGDVSSAEAVAELRALMARVGGSGADHLLASTLYRRHHASWVAHDA